VNTPAHLIIGSAAFARPTRPGSFGAALAGSLAPDLSLYLLAGWSVFVMRLSPEVVFGQLYFSPGWQNVFAVDNSFILWGLLLAVALWRSHVLWATFAASGLLHLACDIALHNEDARRHFWPVTDWVFRSPISYWDKNRHGDVIGLMEMLLVGVLTLVLWRRFSSVTVRLTVLAIAALELLPGLLFGVILDG
jgi:hypothetical protein